MKILEEIEYRGNFWLPTSKERKVKGKLLIQDKGIISLYLYDLLQDPNIENEFSTILGVSDNDI